MDSNQQSDYQKYWEGESSLQEESKLKEYFSGENVAKELLPYKSLFQFFVKESNDVPSDELDKKLMDQMVSSISQKRRIIGWKPLLKYAAAFVFLAFGTFYFFSNQLPSTVEDSAVVYHDDPEDAIKAYNEVKAALALVSRNMDKGTSKASIGISKTKKTNQIFKLLNH